MNASNLPRFLVRLVVKWRLNLVLYPASRSFALHKKATLYLMWEHINKWFFFHFIVWLIGKSPGTSSSWCKEKTWKGGRRTSGKTRDSSRGIKPWRGTDTEEKNQTIWEGQRVIIHYLIKLMQIISASLGIDLDIYLFNAFTFFFYFNRAYERRQRERQVEFRSDFSVKQH